MESSPAHATQPQIAESEPPAEDSSAMDITAPTASADAAPLPSIAQGIPPAPTTPTAVSAPIVSAPPMAPDMAASSSTQPKQTDYSEATEDSK